MKKIYVALTLIFSLNSISAELWTVSKLNESISKLDHELVLLDVRTQAEYDSGHILNAINISHEQILEDPESVSYTHLTLPTKA